MAFTHTFQKFRTFGKDGSILLTNHAFATMIPANFTLLNVFVDDKESPLVRPSIP